MELILAGYFLDIVFGDPHFIPHPIVFIGKSISKFEGILRRFFDRDSRRAKIGGVILALVIITGAYFITSAVLSLSKMVNPYFAKAVEIFMIFQILATKSLAKESRRVYYPLKEGKLMEARRLLSYIVGRDTTSLKEDGITRAAVETIAENTSDAVIAPLFYILIGGAPLGMAYKAVNTLDSMVGYKNEKYKDFGWASAKVDDIANFIPARLTAALIILASMILKYDSKYSLKMVLRDRKKHSSPNCGYPEAAVAGALNVQLGGTNIYFGKPVYKPTIGDDIRKLEPQDINRTIKIMYMSSFLGVGLIAGIKYLINFFIS